MGCCDKKNNKDQATIDSQFACPKCYNNGVRVKMITLKTFLKDDCLSSLNESLLFKFCKNTECEVTYFSENKDVLYYADELKIKATLKNKDLDVHICYCFNYTRQDVLDEIKRTGCSRIVESIKSKMKDPGCFCEKSNPQGVCCLENNMSWVADALILVKKGGSL